MSTSFELMSAFDSFHFGYIGKRDESAKSEYALRPSHLNVKVMNRIEQLQIVNSAMLKLNQTDKWVKQCPLYLIVHDTILESVLRFPCI